MKIILCIILTMATAAAGDSVSAKGCNSGHCAHGVAVSNHSAFQALYQLHDSSFAGFIVLKQDTIHGTMSRFDRDELKFNDGKTVRHISYSRINYMQLNEKAGDLQLAQLHNRSGFFRLLYSGGGVALYDRSLAPHRSDADVDMRDLVIRHDNFNRYLKSDFSEGLRKSVVPVINRLYNTNVSRKTRPAQVYALVAGK